MNLLHFLSFQGLWFAAVLGAAAGHAWAGPAALVVHVALHLVGVPAVKRGLELRALALAGLAGLLMDSGLHALGATNYPTSATPFGLCPAWIVALWIGFASLPRYSLGWLRRRPKPAVLLGAVGGPLSYWGGARTGAVALSDPAWISVVALGVQYAVVTPLLLRWMPHGGD
ncbi:MAG: DUF2878 domain-containing protein [Planctomycetes bacterium]|nr:DUF2878 domain-containing protein [Planctomycetota bacterium]MCB9903912.1 DUF2878 domain-containing protein [Planctomycetota bacterium]